MAVSRVIEVSFGRSSVALVRVNTAYFYNSGIIFKPTDIELPTSYQVHWADSPDKATTIETIGTAEGAPIPDDLWDRSRVIYGWIYLHPTEDSGITAYEVRIYKNVRAGLPDGTEPTPAEQSTIDQAISALNTAVAKTAQDVISADQSARSASGDADRAEQARTAAETAQGKAEDAQESAERAKDDAETSERNASESERKAKGYAETASEKADAITGLTAQATTLPDGSQASASYNAETGVMSFGIPKGKDGTDGDDGYSPTANVSKTGKVATITITDKNGTTSAQVEDGTDGIDGISPSVSVIDITGGHRVVITDKDGAKSFDVEDGATGATPNLTIGTVETLDPTDDATATITGTPENPVLNLGIPQGDAGEVTLADLNSALAEKAPVITDTASGAIASFTDGADNLPLKSLVVDINPVQDLHGQENPYPAGGGKNLCPEKSYIYGSNMYFGGETQNTRILTLPAGTYTFSVIPSDGDPVALYFMDSTNENAYASKSSGTSVTATFESETEVVLKVYSSRFLSGLSITKFQLEKGSTATSWSPYENICPISGWTEVDVNHSGADMTNPTTLTIPIGQTVYGGKLDVLSGELTVDRAMRVFDGSADEAWSIGTSGTHYRGYTYALTDIEPLTGYTTVTNALCDKLKSGTWDNAFRGTLELGQIAKALGFGLDSLGITTTPALNSWLAENPLTIVYPLATPITVQLSANQINSLYGQNNLWADSGDTEVEYRADTKLFIERLTAPDSADMIADANITSGKYFMVGNNLYKATANIANGSAIIVGTNCIRKSLSEALNEINA